MLFEVLSCSLQDRLCILVRRLIRVTHNLNLCSTCLASCSLTLVLGLMKCRYFSFENGKLLHNCFLNRCLPHSVQVCAGTLFQPLKTDLEFTNLLCNNNNNKKMKKLAWKVIAFRYLSFTKGSQCLSVMAGRWLRKGPLLLRLLFRDPIYKCQKETSCLLPGQRWHCMYGLGLEIF